jgi:hypothetical protein
LGCTPVWSADIYWHIRSGQLIWERGAVPRTDWFLYYGWDRPWIDLWWLFELLLAGLYALGGVDLLVLGKALLLALIVAFGWRAAGNRLPAWARAACWLLPVVCLSARSTFRPELLTLVFLGVWLLVLERSERRPRLIWLLPALQVLWVNCQSLFVLGPILWCGFLADRFVRGRRVEGAGLAAPPARQLLAVTLLLGLACLANPYFLDGLLLPLIQFGMLDWGIAEFMSPLALVQKDSGATRYIFSALILWLVTAASFVWAARSSRLSLFRLFAFTAFSYLLWQAYRNIGPFGLVAGVVLCGNCGDIVEGRGVGAWGAERRQRLLGFAATGLLGLLTLSVVTQQWHPFWNQGYVRFGLGESERHFGHEAARFAGQPGFPVHAFLLDYTDASAYILHNAPERRVFLYGRMEGAGETFRRIPEILRYMQVGDPRWVEMISDPEHGRPAVVIPRSYSGLIRGIGRTPGWRLVHISRSVVFVDEETAERLGLPDLNFDARGS